MLGIDPKAVRATWSVVVTLGALALLYEARVAVLLVVASVFFAYLLFPVLTLVSRFASGRLSRTVALTLVYILLIAVIGGVASAVASRAAREAVTLAARIPELGQSAAQLRDAPLPVWLEPLRGQLFDWIRAQIEGGMESLLPMLKTAAGQVLSTLGNVGFALLIPILSFFMIKDGEQLRGMLVEVFARRGREGYIEGLLDDMHIMLGQYIRALFLLSVMAFTAYEIFFQMAGVPYASLLATIGGVLEFVPVVGPLITALLACVVAAVAGYSHIGWMIVFLIGFRLFQDYVVQPYLLGGGLELHPLWILVGALAGEQVAGIPGMVLSVPVMATARLVWLRSHRATAASS